jgi:hypothetical protein
VFHTTKHALPVNGMTPMILVLTKLALIYLNDLVRTADLLRAALHVYEHCLCTELSPVRDRSRTEVMLFFDTFRRYAVHDVVC